MNYYITRNETMHYWRIWIKSTLPEDDAMHIFKGKTIDGALKSAQRYCDDSNSKIKYKTLTVGEVAYECDFWGRKKTITIQAPSKK